MSIIIKVVPWQNGRCLFSRLGNTIMSAVSAAKYTAKLKHAKDSTSGAMYDFVPHAVESVGTLGVEVK